MQSPPFYLIEQDSFSLNFSIERKIWLFKRWDNIKDIQIQIFLDSSGSLLKVRGNTEK